MQKPAFDPGLTQQYTGNLRRAINKDGTFNVRRRGATWRDFHPYLHLIGMGWIPFFGLLFLGYLVVNTLFALGYFWLGSLPCFGGAGFSLPIRAKLGLPSVLPPVTPTLFSFPLILKAVCDPRVRNPLARQLTSRCGKTDSRRSRLRRCRRRRS